jgi:hypothetical protein
MMWKVTLTRLVTSLEITSEEVEADSQEAASDAMQALLDGKDPQWDPSDLWWDYHDDYDTDSPEIAEIEPIEEKTEGMKTKTAYRLHWYSKVDCDVGGKTLADMALGLRFVAAVLDEMHRDGIAVEDVPELGDGHAEFVTYDPTVARRWGFYVEE